MKSFLGWAGRLAFTFVFAINAYGKTFVDPSLDAWLSVNDENALSSSYQTVIVFLKTPTYHDHTGLSAQQALIEEKSFVYSTMREQAKELSTILPLQSQKMDFLWASNAVVAQVDRTALLKLIAHRNVEAVVFNQTITLDDPRVFADKDHKNKTDESTVTYGLQLIHADAAWNQGITGEGVKIGVIDTGVDEEHQDLKGKVFLKKDFTDENNNIDGNGHGTHVSGTIAGGNASGTQIGVAPGAKIIMAKALDSKGSGSLANLLRAMEWMLDPDGDPSTNDAPRLVSNSWGAPSQFIYGFRNAVRNWRRFGVLPNFAAGNSGPSYFSANSPGSYPFSFAVGAVDENATITSFSSRGPVIWWKTWHPIFVRKPDIAAPGLYVKSSVPGNGYEIFSGTSMATPHIAGVAALAFQANPNLTIENMIEILNTSGLAQTKKGGDNRYGHGVIQVDQVIEKAKSWKVNAPSFFQDKDPNLWEWDTP